MYNINIIETNTFIKQAETIGLSNDELENLKKKLIENPFIGDVIPGLSGIRKVRIGIKSKRIGKRGGARVIYLAVMADSTIFLLLAYEKNRKSDLSKSEKDELVKLVEMLKQKLGEKDV